MYSYTWSVLLYLILIVMDTVQIILEFCQYCLRIRVFSIVTIIAVVDYSK